MTRRLPLNAFLLRGDATPDRLLTEEATRIAAWHEWRFGELVPIDAILDDVIEATTIGDVLVALIERPGGLPPWQSFVRESLGVATFGAQVNSLGAVIACAVADPVGGGLRWVCFTFGSASRSVSKRALVPRFGLLVALNRLARRPAEGGASDPGALLRQASYRARGASSFQADHRAARDTSLDNLRLDRLSDLLSAAGGRVGPDEASSQVYGGRSLRVHEKVADLQSLSGLAAEALQDFRSTDYRIQFGFVDQMVPVDDEAMERQIREQLTIDIQANASTVDVLLPDDLTEYQSDQTICFIVRPNETLRKASDVVLTMEMVRQMIGTGGAAGLDYKLRFADSSRKEIAACPIIDCLAAEVSLGDDRYLCYDGDFFLVDRGLIARVDAEVAAIPISSLDLPSYRGRSEAEWNVQVSASSPTQYVHLDGKLIRLDGQTPFEACDILGVDGVLIHAKRKSRSSTMSHLFVQAARSAELLIDIPEARSQLIEHIRTERRACAQDASKPVAVVDALGSPAHGTQVVLALLGDWHHRDMTNLPILVKLTLIATASTLRRSGFLPSVALVGLSSR